MVQGQAAQVAPEDIPMAFKTVYRMVTTTRQAIIVPRHLSVSGNLPTEERKRGIYSSLVYSASLKLEGSFDIPSKEEFAKLLQGWGIKKIDWAAARLVVGLSDTSAIRSVSQLKLGQKLYDMGPGNGAIASLPEGFSAPVSLAGQGPGPGFSLDLDFAGSSAFYVSTVAHVTEINLSSNWPHPSFLGDGLPIERSVSDSGFTAKWSVPDLVHSHPGLSLANNDYNDEGYNVGASFYDPIDTYRLIQRSTKFGLMFVILTFLVLFIGDLLESRGGKASQALANGPMNGNLGAGGKGRGHKASHQLHPLQYGLVGLALALFYLILLSLSERLGFDLAYLVASALTVAMIGLYAISATQSRTRGLLATVLTAILYGVLYLILRQEDYSLISGTTLLVVVTLALMFLTRNLNKGETLLPWETNLAQANQGEPLATGGPHAKQGESPAPDRTDGPGQG
jgi:inner membrane protein